MTTHLLTKKKKRPFRPDGDTYDFIIIWIFYFFPWSLWNNGPRLWREREKYVLHSFPLKTFCRNVTWEKNSAFLYIYWGFISIIFYSYLKSTVHSFSSSGECTKLKFSLSSDSKICTFCLSYTLFSQVVSWLPSIQFYPYKKRQYLILKIPIG